jgi:glutathione synthase/RimK-type ligase-like ATP-grasp enzyme
MQPQPCCQLAGLVTTKNRILKLAIHHTPNSFSNRWIDYCSEKQIDYKLVNCYGNDIILQLKDCSALLWHHQQGNPKDLLFAKQLLFSLQHADIKVFPDFFTGWHFNDKLGQKYLLEAADMPLVPGYVFFIKKDAVNWVNKAVFPKVFKLRSGAGSSNVHLVKTKEEALQLVNIAFGKGFLQYQPFTGFKERVRKFKSGKTGIKDLLKGLARFIVPPPFARIGGREIGYVYFQDFIDGNDHDIRVVVIAGRAFAIKRMVRENDFRASGSGNILYDRELFDEDIIRLSFSVAEKLRTQCLALDYIQKDGRPMILEVSFGFLAAGYDPCPGYWDKEMNWHEGKFNPYGWMVDEIMK